MFQNWVVSPNLGKHNVMTISFGFLLFSLNLFRSSATNFGLLNLCLISGRVLAIASKRCSPSEELLSTHVDTSTSFRNFQGCSWIFMVTIVYAALCRIFVQDKSVLVFGYISENAESVSFQKPSGN